MREGLRKPPALQLGFSRADRRRRRSGVRAGRRRRKECAPSSGDTSLEIVSVKYLERHLSPAGFIVSSSAYRGMRILITGGRGTLGRPLVGALENGGHEVWVCDLGHSPSPRYFRCDVGEYRQLERVVGE